MKRREFILVIIVALSIAISILTNHILADKINPFILSFLRAIICFPIILVAMKMSNAKFPQKADLLFSVWMGLFYLVIPFFSISLSQKHLMPGIGGLFYSFTPIFSLLISSIFFDANDFKINKIIGLILGIIGVACILIKLPSGTNIKESHLFYYLIALLGPVSYSIGTIFAKFKYHELHPLSLSSGMFFGAIVILLPFVFFNNNVNSNFDFELNAAQIFSLVILATIGTAVPAMLNYVLVNRIGVVRVGLSMFITPIFSIFFGIFMFNEAINSFYILGFLFIIVSCFFTLKENHRK